MIATLIDYTKWSNLSAEICTRLFLRNKQLVSIRMNMSVVLEKIVRVNSLVFKFTKTEIRFARCAFHISPGNSIPRQQDYTHSDDRTMSFLFPRQPKAWPPYSVCESDHLRPARERNAPARLRLHSPSLTIRHPADAPGDLVVYSARKKPQQTERLERWIREPDDQYPCAERTTSPLCHPRTRPSFFPPNSTISKSVHALGPPVRPLPLA